MTKFKGNPRFLRTDGAEKPLEVTSQDFDIAVHNAVITIEHDGNHRTFMIRTIQEGESIGRPGDRIVSLLSGAERENPRNWTSFGFVLKGGVVTVFHKKRGQEEGGRYKKSPFEYYANMLMHPANWETRGYRYLLLVFCNRCNKPLTVPESIRSGLGPYCRKVVAKD